MGRRKKKKHKKNKKENNVAHYYQYSRQTTVPTPETGTNPYDLAIITHREDVIHQICERALESDDAHGNEFQFHYTGLQVILTHPTGIKLVITFPTAYFNFPQEVSGALIEYNLEDIAAVREQVMDASMEQAEKIIKVIEPIISLYKQAGYDIKLLHEEFGSVHRHPGKFSFSATDLRNDPNNPGVIFRNLKAKDYYQFDHVIYVQEKSKRGAKYVWNAALKKLIDIGNSEADGKRLENAEFVTSQCRLVNVEPVNGVDGSAGIKGSYLTTPTILFEKKAESSENSAARLSIEDIAKTFANIDPQLKVKKPVSKTIDKYNIMHFQGTATIPDDVLETYANIIDVALNAYDPVIAINPDFITERRFSYYYTSKYNTSSAASATSKTTTDPTPIGEKDYSYTRSDTVAKDWYEEWGEEFEWVKEENNDEVIDVALEEEKTEKIEKIEKTASEQQSLFDYNLDPAEINKKK